mmetsp:Transcript_44770/g.108586  ORF Transcript_44770/g.108586 Transcript_44770/m.108586 type:complete len:234 (+) Transcript_44770:1206-1907(+)
MIKMIQSYRRSLCLGTKMVTWKTKNKDTNDASHLSMICHKQRCSTILRQEEEVLLSHQVKLTRLFQLEVQTKILHRRRNRARARLPITTEMMKEHSQDVNATNKIEFQIWSVKNGTKSNPNSIRHDWNGCRKKRPRIIRTCRNRLLLKAMTPRRLHQILRGLHYKENLPQMKTGDESTKEAGHPKIHHQKEPLRYLICDSLLSNRKEVALMMYPPGEYRQCRPRRVEIEATPR